MARPRGYAAWNPNDESLLLVSQVKQVLVEYADYLPLTARQIFYRLVGSFGYDKTEKAYAKLCEKLVRARRAQMIPFTAIRDDKVTEHAAGAGYDSPSEFWDGVRNSGRYYQRPTREGQDYHIEFWTEASGMSEMISRVARPYGVPVYSAGGFLSVTATHAIAERAYSSDIPTVALHIGDYDPSGESIFDAMMRDALHFYAARSGGGRVSDYEGDFHAIRVALTWDQVEEYGVETAPPKPTDSRSANWVGETAQLEAIPPDLLTDLCRDAIEEWTSLDLMENVRARGKNERDQIVEHLEELIDE